MITICVSYTSAHPKNAFCVTYGVPQRLAGNISLQPGQVKLDIVDALFCQHLFVLLRERVGIDLLIEICREEHEREYCPR